MSTIKISELPQLTGFNANPANTIFVGVDLANNTTVHATLDTLINRFFSNVASVQFSDSTTMSSSPATLTYSNASFAAANLASSNTVYLSGVANVTNTSIINNTSNIATNKIYSQAAFNQSNTNLGIINYLGGALNATNSNVISLQSSTSNNSANIAVLQLRTSNNSSNIANLQIYSAAAFAKANNALANTTGTFAGDLTITGNTTVNNYSTFKNDIKLDGGIRYTPNVLNNITTLSVDFNRDSLVRANGTGSIAITLSNFIAGKEVVVWYTNNGGGGAATITHGCLANNSTVNADTFSMPSTSTAYLRYYSIDGDLSNTFVAITHA